MWSGPSRALQFHMEMFETADKMTTWLKANHGHQVTRNLVPASLTQRMLLQTSMSIVDHSTNVDGKSASLVRSSENEAFTQENVTRTAFAVKNEHQILNEGQTFYVSLHMQEMISAMAEKMGSEPLFETDLPSPTGVIVFERPLLMPDLHPDTGELTDDILIPIRSFGWRKSDVSVHGEAKPGIEYMLWTDGGAYVKYYVASLKRLGLDPGRENAEDNLSYYSFWKTDHSGWSFGTPWEESSDGQVDIDSRRIETDEGTIHTAVAMQRRWLLAFFRLYWQRILIPETYHPTRPERRRAHRMRRPLEDGYIKVVRLRREVEVERRRAGGESVSHYDHQFIVSAHPRRQWFKSLGPARNPDGTFNHDSHRLIWIESHIKGPVTGPLVVGQQVQALVR